MEEEDKASEVATEEEKKRKGESVERFSDMMKNEDECSDEELTKLTKAKLKLTKQRRPWY